MKKNILKCFVDSQKVRAMKLLKAIIQPCELAMNSLNKITSYKL
jgi:hypothetical protein